MDRALGRSMMVTSKIYNDEKGSFLLSTLLFAVMVSLMLFYLWHKVNQAQHFSDKNRWITSRDLVVTSAVRNARIATFYYRSIIQNDPVNDMFIKCVIDDDIGSDCLVAGGPFPMSLVDFDATTSTYIPIIGASTTPTAYNIYGQVCAASSIDCPFDVSATFTPTCAAAAASCPSADSMKVSVTVQVNAAFDSPFARLAAVVADQTVAIRDYQNYYFPVLPPHNTPGGIPLTQETGPFGSGPGPGPAPGPAPASATTPGAGPSACNTGEIKGATCGKMQF